MGNDFANIDINDKFQEGILVYAVYVGCLKVTGRVMLQVSPNISEEPTAYLIRLPEDGGSRFLQHYTEYKSRRCNT